MAKKSDPQFEVPVSQALTFGDPVRAKHWFRVLHRSSQNGGVTWTSWWRWSSDDAWSGCFQTLKEAKAAIAPELARHKREAAAGKARVSVGGLGMEMKVEKGRRVEFRIVEEVTLVLGEEEVAA